ncbi:ABC transporter ATP-binding protein [Pararhizobium sp. IMCC21322]|uniref:ABC transporter ATP-binding protein n=1 Tax=Pararhizobium sp. IMCC21322 TaxID=3067903 RepID=UPI002741F31D|nr:sn-glycerol-3-phosphate ABC transporter ATP-binding protein UgpC [Pararhizobium sp. IMCC21322]
MATIELNKVIKRYGDVQVIHGVDLSIADKEFVVLVGPSGCGKSTLLRMIAGLEDISDGTISIGGSVVNEKAPKERDIAMVFQDYALYPHLDVYRNMSFALEVRRMKATEIRRRVERAAKILNLEELFDRKPAQLSGGQRQRVAMGRAMVREPVAFLFDEPLSNLDAKLRGEMRTEIRKLHQEVQKTIVYVTHDQVEAMTLAERIVVMRSGYVEQIGTPNEVYNHPATLFVGGFIGAPRMNQLPCVYDPKNGGKLSIAGGPDISVPTHLTEATSGLEGRRLVLGIRPEAFILAKADSTADAFTAKIDFLEPLGSDTLVFLHVGDVEVIARLPPLEHLREGNEITLALDSPKLHLFDADTEQAITKSSPVAAT